MPEKVYEIIALAARYWFALLGLVIVWQSFIWLRRDRRDKHRRLRQLPDAGMIGEMVVIQGSDELPEGSTMPIPHEGVLGYLRTCDVVAPVKGVASYHCDFTFVPGKGLLVFPRGGHFVLVDGEFVHKRRESKQHPMHHGSRLQVGEAVLRLRVFVGLEVARYAAPMADEPEEFSPPFPPPPPQPDWQDAPYVYHQVPAQWDAEPFQPVSPYDPYQPDLPPPYGYPPDLPPMEPQGVDPFAPADPPVTESPRRRRPFGRRDTHGEA